MVLLQFIETSDFLNIKKYQIKYKRTNLLLYGKRFYAKKT